MTQPATTPAISIVLVDGSFRERFHAVDFLARQTLPAEAYEILWVEHYEAPAPALAGRMAALPNARAIALGRTGTYHSSYCFNAGIVAARGEVIVLPDADVVVERDFLERVWEDHQRNERLALYVHRLDEPEAAVGEDSASLPHLRRVCTLNSPSNWGGCLSVRKRWLLELNGYEQHPLFETGDHGNAYDVYTRLKNLGLDVRWHPTLRLYHPWHPGTARYTVRHRRQAIVTNWRAVTLQALAFQGIDAARDVGLPADLVERLERETGAENPEKALPGSSAAVVGA